MKFTAVALALLTSFVAAQDAPDTAPQSVAPPTGVTISSLAYGGTGCPQGSVGYVYSLLKISDNQFFHLRGPHDLYFDLR